MQRLDVRTPSEGLGTACHVRTWLFAQVPVIILGLHQNLAAKRSPGPHSAVQMDQDPSDEGPGSIRIPLQFCSFPRPSSLMSPSTKGILCR